MLNIKNRLRARQNSELEIETASSGYRRQVVIFAAFFALIGVILIIRSFAAAPYKQVNFDSDPGWEGVNNRPDGSIACVNRSFNFGWDNRKLALPQPKGGVIGGKFERSLMHRAYYAQVLPQPKTLNDKLSVSGSVMIPEASGGSAMFGWFNTKTSYAWRPNDFLGIRVGGQGKKSKLVEEYSTSKGLINGIKTINVDMAIGQSYNWSVDYSPTGGEHNSGFIRFQVADKVEIDPLLPEHKADGAIFDRFGFINNMNDGPPLTVYMDDVTVNGVKYEFNTDPGWEGSNNKLTNANDCYIHDRLDFGYSNTNLAGGQPGEIGGIIWRTTGKKGHYADKIGNLSFKDRLYAEGKINLKMGANDGDFYVGWFNENTVVNKGKEPSQFLGVHVGGPSSWGQRIFPEYGPESGDGKSFDSKLSPPLSPKNTPRNFWVCYQPPPNAGADGLITMGVVADPANGISEQKVSLPVKKEAANSNITLNRFGIRNNENGGGHGGDVFYLDDLRYTIGPGDSGPTERCGSSQTIDKYQVSGSVFNDTNNNGKFDASDTKLVDEEVLLQKPNGDTITSQKTDSSGGYKFSDLIAGRHRVTHKVPSGYERTTDDSRSFDLPPNQTWDFGIHQKNQQTSPYEGKIIYDPANGRQFYVSGGKRQYISNPVISYCINIRRAAGHAKPVSASAISSLSQDSRDAWCYYEQETGLNFVRESGTPTVWLVKNNGFKRHVGALCAPNQNDPSVAKRWRVFEVPFGETAGHSFQGVFFPTDYPTACYDLPPI